MRIRAVCGDGAASPQHTDPGQIKTGSLHAGFCSLLEQLSSLRQRLSFLSLWRSVSATVGRGMPRSRAELMGTGTRLRSWYAGGADVPNISASGTSLAADAVALIFLTQGLMPRRRFRSPFTSTSEFFHGAYNVQPSSCSRLWASLGACLDGRAPLPRFSNAMAEFNEVEATSFQLDTTSAPGSQQRGPILPIMGRSPFRWLGVFLGRYRRPVD